MVGKLDTQICDGCSKAAGWTATGWVCTVYAEKRKTYGYRMGECAFNTMRVLPRVSGKVRVGQQKQRKF